MESKSNKEKQEVKPAPIAKIKVQGIIKSEDSFLYYQGSRIILLSYRINKC